MTAPLLARDGLDFGLPTDHGEAMEEWYEKDLGLTFIQKDTIAPGYYETFYELHRSWLKLNPADVAMEPAVTGYQELLVASSDVEEPEGRTDPDGNRITLVPAGHRGVDEIGLVIATHDLVAHRRFILEGMGGTDLGDGIRVGNTVMFLEPVDAPFEVTPILRRGFTMLTLVVSDLATAHARLLAAGGIHGLRGAVDPAYPERALFSFVRDPAGNWIELCQLSELTGPLPELAEPPPDGDEFVAFRDHGTPA